jgi:hypothetical protein
MTYVDVFVKPLLGNFLTSKDYHTLKNFNRKKLKAHKGISILYVLCLILVLFVLIIRKTVIL